jgi:hypothetical protein
MYEFYSRVRSITVIFKSTHGSIHNLKLKRCDIVKPLQTVRESELILPSQIYVGDKILDEGYWDIRWMATLDSVGSSPSNPLNATEEMLHTNESYSYTLEVKDNIRVSSIEHVKLVEMQCKVAKGHLANVLQRFHNSQSGSNRFTVHETIVHAAKMHRRLKAALGKAGNPPSEMYDELGSMLDSCRGTLATLEELNLRQEKKDDARRFKSFMAGVLESENPVGWMKKVQSHDLEELGGDVNRLYQLFIEGKGKCALLIDSDMLLEASTRNDLFSAKQCKELSVRSEAAAIQEAKEEEESRAASERQLAEEETRKKLMREAEMRKNWEMVGNVVVINGLQSDVGKEMNGENAKVVYYISDKDRFEVEVTSSGKKALLKKENLSLKYFGHPSYNYDHSPTPKSPPRAANKAVKSSHSTSSNNSRAAKSPARVTNKAVKSTNSTTSSKASISNKSSASEKAQQHDKTKLPKEKALQNNGGKAQTGFSHSTPASGFQNANSSSGSTNSRTEKTVYVASTMTKKLTGKKGRAKKSLEDCSGAKIDIHSSRASNGYVPVSLFGTQNSVVRAMVLVQNAVGSEHVQETIPTPKSPKRIPASRLKEEPTSNLQSTPVVGSHAPPIQTVPSDSKTKDASDANPRELFPPGFLGIQTEGFSNVQTEVDADIPSQLPSEIGIRSNYPRDPMTDGSVSSLNDRSHSSRTLLQQHFSLPENDPLLLFLRSQQSCIKGSVDEFFLWLVKSEDVDTIAALKEAVSDEEYLAETMKNGNGSVGLKGFKVSPYTCVLSVLGLLRLTDMCFPL